MSRCKISRYENALQQLQLVSPRWPDCRKICGFSATPAYVRRLSGCRQRLAGSCPAMQHAWPQPVSSAIHAVAPALGRSYKQALPYNRLNVGLHRKMPLPDSERPP
jgi:hypothetical protein